MKINLQAAIDGKIDAELNLALCEWLGWKPHSELDNRWCAPHQTTAPLVVDLIPLPNHITAAESLGRVHEVEKKLQNQELAYQDNLAGIVDAGDESTYWWEACHYRHRLITATARQRVIALLQTVKPEIFEYFK